MTDFTKNLSTTVDFSANMGQELQQEYTEDPALSTEAAALVTEQARTVFGVDVPEANTQGDLDELNQIVYQDYSTVAQEADTEAVMDLVAEGQIKEPVQASALLSTMKTQGIGKNTALSEMSSEIMYQEAIKDGDVAAVPQEEYIKATPEYLRLTDKEKAELGIGQYNTPEAIASKRMILQQHLANLSGTRTTGQKAADFAIGLVPFVSDARSYEGRFTSEDLVTNRTLEDVSYFDKLLLNPYLSPEDLDSLLTEYETKVSPTAAIQKYQSIVDRSMFSDQVFFGLDVVAVGAGVKAVSKAAKGGYTVAKSLGATVKEATEAAVEAGVKTAVKEAAAQVPLLTTAVDVVRHPAKIRKALSNRTHFAKTLADGVIPDSAFVSTDSSKLALEEIVNTAVSPRLTRENVSQVGNMPVVKAGKESQELTRDLTYAIDTNTGSLQIMNEEHLETLRTEALENFLKEHPRASIDHADVVHARVDPIKNSLDETYTFRYQIGTGANNSSPFVTKEAAEEYARALKIKGSSEIIQDANGFWIQFDTKSTNSLGSLADIEFEREALAGGAANIKKRASGGLSAAVRGVTAQSTAVRRMNALTQHEKDSFLLPLLRDAISSMTNLNKHEKAQLDIIVEAGRKAQKWISEDWLKANGASDAVIKAYNNYKALNDTHYLYANRALKKQLTERGGVEVYFNGTRKGIEFEVPFDASLDTSKYWFRIDGSDEIQHITSSKLAELKQRGYRMTETPYGDKDISASMIRHLYNPSQYEGRTLKGMLIEYIPGGRKFYSDDNMFIKQLQIGEAEPRYKGQRITHPKYIYGVNTITAGESIDDARKFAAALEEARQTWIQFSEGLITSAEATADLQKGLGATYSFAGTLESFEAWAKARGISKHPAAIIEAVKDGDTLESYTDIMRAGLTEDIIEGTDKFKRSASSLYSEEMKIRKRQRTGGDIEEIFDGFTPVRMNPEEEMKRLVNEITNFQTMDAFTSLFRDNFKRIYKDVINPNMLKSNVLDESALVARTSSNKALHDSAKSAIRQYKTIRNVPNKFDEKIIEGFDKVARMVGVSEDTMKKVYGFNAPQKARELVSWLNFAGAPAQFIRQGFAITNTHLQAVGAASEADALMFLYPFFKTKDSKVIAHGLKACGKEAEDIGALTKFFDNVDKIRSKGRYTEGGIIDPGTDFSKTFVKGSYYFYTKGESINRVHSAITTALVHGGGWKNNKFKAIDYNSLKAPELAEIANRYNRYYMNMDAAGLAPVQTSKVFQTFFHFQTYKMRWLEMVADTELTKAQKGAFYLGHLALFGMMGLGAGNVTWFGENEASRALSMGLLNYGMEAIFGDERFLPDLSELGASRVVDFFSYGLEAGKTLQDLPLFRAGNQFVQSAFKLARAGAALYNTPKYNTGAFLENMKELVTSSDNPISGIARSARGAEAFIMNSLYNSRGITSAKDITNLQSILYILGFDNLRDSQMYEMSKSFGKAKAEPKELARVLTKAYLNYMQNPLDNSAWMAYSTLRQSVLQDVPYTVEVEVNEILDRTARDNYKDSLDKYIEIKVKEAGYTDPEVKLKGE
jgi:hypothetical protein